MQFPGQFAGMSQSPFGQLGNNQAGASALSNQLNPSSLEGRKQQLIHQLAGNSRGQSPQFSMPGMTGIPTPPQGGVNTVAQPGGINGMGQNPYYALNMGQLGSLLASNVRV